MPKDKIDWISVQDNTRPQYIYPGEVAVTGRMTAARMYKSNSAPTVNNDGIDSLGLGQVFYKTDLWHDAGSNKFYFCNDNSAVWTLANSAEQGLIGTKAVDETDLGDQRIPWYNSATGVFEYGDRWDDLRFPFQQAKRGSGDKPDYDETNIGLLFPQNVATEYVTMLAQLPHGYKLSSDLSPHVHYIQTAAAVPTFKLEYRWYGIGNTVPAFSTIQTTTTPVISTTYAAERHQLLVFPDITGAAITGVSSILDMKLYRDDNVVTNDVLFKEFDIHIRYDGLGSEREDSKT